jgi:hypothetical protein
MVGPRHLEQCAIAADTGKPGCRPVLFIEAAKSPPLQCAAASRARPRSVNTRASAAAAGMRAISATHVPAGHRHWRGAGRGVILEAEPARGRAARDDGTGWELHLQSKAGKTGK